MPPVMEQVVFECSCRIGVEKKKKTIHLHNRTDNLQTDMSNVSTCPMVGTDRLCILTPPRQIVPVSSVSKIPLRFKLYITKKLIPHLS